MQVATTVNWVTQRKTVRVAKANICVEESLELIFSCTCGPDGGSAVERARWPLGECFVT